MAKADAKAEPAEDTATEGGEPQTTGEAIGAPIEPDAIEAAELAADAALDDDAPAPEGQDAPSIQDTPAEIAPEGEEVAEVDAEAQAAAEAHAAALAAVDRKPFYDVLNVTFRAALASGVTVGDLRYATDDAGKAALIEAAIFGGPDGCIILGVDGHNVRVTPEELQAVVVAVRDHRQACFENAQRLRAHLDANLTPEMVDLSEGWPA